MQHSVIPPSAAGMWVHCPGWPTLAHACPDEHSGEAAAEGTASHEIFPQLIDIHVNHANSPSARAKLHDKLIGNPASNGVIITEEMWQGAEVFADYVGEIMANNLCWAPHVEERVDASLYIHPNSFGMVDCWIYLKRLNTLFIVDYKFGHGVVEAFENWQGINYFAGIISADHIRINDPKVVITIVQPRARHRDGIIRHWDTDAEELQHYVSKLSKAAHRALSHDAPCITGVHCHHCKARARCPAMAQASANARDVAGWPIPDELDGHQLGLELDFLRNAADMLKYRISGLETQAEATARNGEYVRGYTVRDYFGNNTWVNEPETVIAFGESIGIDLRKTAVLTPPEAIKAGVPKEVVEEMTDKPRRGTRLEKVKDTDGRRIFGRVKESE